MTTSTKTRSKGSPDKSVKKAVERTPGGTTEGIAGVAGIGRSTAGKVLARLADAGEVTRHQGGRDHGKRLPDRWTLVGVEMPADYAGRVLAAEQSAAPASGAKDAKTGDGTTSANNTEGGKLKPGGLDPLVLGYLKDNADSGPHGPTDIAKALQRSSGAVGNCQLCG